MQNACDIVMLTMNNYQFTEACLRSLFSCDAGFPFNVHVFDNASSDGTPDNLIRDFRGKLRLWRSDSNLGFSGGNNKVLERTKSRFACLLNNDTIVTPGWLGEMVAAAECGRRVGVVGSRGNNANPEGRPEQAVDLDISPGQVGAAEELQRAATRLSRAQPRFSEAASVVGYCMLLRRSMLNRIGLLDTRFWPGNFEDDDLCHRAREAGYKIVIANRSLVYHFVSSTMKSATRWRHMFRVNRGLFRSKWVETGREADIGSRPRPRLRLAVEMPRNRAAAHRALAVCDELRLRGCLVHTFGPPTDSPPPDRMVPHVASQSPERMYASSAVVLHRQGPPELQDGRAHVRLAFDGKYNPSKPSRQLVIGRKEDWRFAPDFVSVRWSGEHHRALREGAKNRPEMFHEMVDKIEDHLLRLQEKACEETPS